MLWPRHIKQKVGIQPVKNTKTTNQKKPQKPKPPIISKVYVTNKTNIWMGILTDILLSLFWVWISPTFYW